MPERLVIVGSDGVTEHSFPPGMDPQKAIAIVREQEAPKVMVGGKPMSVDDYNRTQQSPLRPIDPNEPDTYWDGVSKSLHQTVADTREGIGRGVRTMLDPRPIIEAARTYHDPTVEELRAMGDRPPTVTPASVAAFVRSLPDPKAGGEAIGQLGAALVLGRAGPAAADAVATRAQPILEGARTAGQFVRANPVEAATAVVKGAIRRVPVVGKATVGLGEALGDVYREATARGAGVPAAPPSTPAAAPVPTPVETAPPTPPAAAHPSAAQAAYQAAQQQQAAVAARAQQMPEGWRGGYQGHPRATPTPVPEPVPQMRPPTSEAVPATPAPTVQPLTDAQLYQARLARAQADHAMLQRWQAEAQARAAAARAGRAVAPPAETVRTPAPAATTPAAHGGTASLANFQISDMELPEATRLYHAGVPPDEIMRLIVEQRRLSPVTPEARAAAIRHSYATGGWANEPPQ